MFHPRFRIKIFYYCQHKINIEIDSLILYLLLSEYTTMFNFAREIFVQITTYF